MKKVLIAVLTLTMLLAIAVSATAERNSYKIYNMPCEAIADNMLYKYHGDTNGGVDKTFNNHTVQISHTVAQVSADETNRIAAYCFNTGKTMGVNWHKANGTLYPCTSNAISTGKSYTAAGRGNTNYASKYGLNKITISGSIDSYDD